MLAFLAFLVWRVPALAASPEGLIALAAGLLALFLRDPGKRS